MAGPEILDLDPESRSALEFDAVLDLVAAHAATRAGADSVRALVPLADVAAIEAEQAAVAEAGRHLDAQGRLVARGLPDPGPALRALAVEGLRAEPLALRDLASVLLAAADLRRQVARLPEAEFPRLRRLAGRIADLRSEAGSVLAGVGPDGRIADDASPELRRIRGAIARVGGRLRRMLESFLHDPASASVIRDEFVTQRNGRFVIPVRADAPRSVVGIVHAASSSGATLFVEPLESVELNNELVRLSEEEASERERIVEGWSRRFRDRWEETVAATDALAVFDSLQARALFGRDAGATRPVAGEGGALLLKDVRHPLLDRRLGEQGLRCVPVTVVLDPADQVLLLSGPNAGGKTVALKTLGVAVLMAHAGVPVVASEARVPCFRQARADIGDHQSIDADLSTFSAHVRAVARFLEDRAPPALFLFDEIGTGTEPTEGAILAQAVLEHLRSPGMTTVATTHLAALKAWAFTTPGAASAALEFDEEAMRPTFRVLMGTAGTSAGIEIAARLGLPGEVVARARSLEGGGGERAEAYLKRVRELASELEERRAELAEAQGALEEERRRLAARAASETERRRKEAQAALREALEEFREAGRREVAAVRDRKERTRLEREQAKAEMRLTAEVERRRHEAGGTEPDAGSEASPVEPLPGMKVRVRSLGREGEVVAVREGRVDVRLGSATFTVGRADVVAVAAPSAPPPAGRQPGRPRPRAATGPDLGDGAPREIVLIGKTVDEALPELDKYLDTAALEGWAEVRVVHGHGTGRLRTAVRAFLESHPHAESHRPGDAREGGDGATVVRLK